MADPLDAVAEETARAVLGISGDEYSAADLDIATSRTRAALAPHWPTVAVTEAAVEDIAIWVRGLIDAPESDLDINVKNDTREVLRASGVGVVPSRLDIVRATVRAHERGCGLVVCDCEMKGTDVADELTAIGGQRD